MTLYEFLKFLHVFMAIVAVGFNATYGIWLAIAARQPQQAGFVLSGIKVLDDRFANPAYGLLLITGFAMVFESGLSFGTFWIATSLGLFVLIVILGLVGYTPTLRSQIATVKADGADSDEYRALAKRGGILGGVLGALTVIIVFLMVTKPTL